MTTRSSGGNGGSVHAPGAFATYVRPADDFGPALSDAPIQITVAFSFAALVVGLYLVYAYLCTAAGPFFAVLATGLVTLCVVALIGKGARHLVL